MKTTAVIIGGTSGVGLATALRFSRAGAEVVIGGRDRRKLAAALEQLGAAGRGYVVDATSAPELNAFYEKAGAFTHLVLSLSGAKGAGTFAGLDLEELRQGFEAKYWAQVMAAQAALPYLAEDGSLTFVTAVSAQMANPGTAGLAAINGALERMIPVLAVELAPLRVNGVSPGVVDTPWWGWLPAEQRQASFAQYSRQAPLGRVGEPNDLAAAIYALATNRFVTGQVLAVDGGLRLKAGG